MMLLVKFLILAAIFATIACIAVSLVSTISLLPFAVVSKIPSERAKGGISLVFVMISWAIQAACWCEYAAFCSTMGHAYAVGAGAAWAWLYYILAFELNISVIQWLTLQESQAADYNKNKLYGAWIYAGLSSIAFIVFCFNQSWAHLALPSFVNIYR
jgi:hypothetical protein